MTDEINYMKEQREQARAEILDCLWAARKKMEEATTHATWAHMPGLRDEIYAVIDRITEARLRIIKEETR